MDNVKAVIDAAREIAETTTSVRVEAAKVACQFKRIGDNLQELQRLAEARPDEMATSAAELDRMEVSPAWGPLLRSAEIVLGEFRLAAELAKDIADNFDMGVQSARGEGN